MMNAFVRYMRRNAARVYGLLVAAVALVLHYVPSLPGDLILGLIAAGLALFGGEVVQRVERRKVSESYWDGMTTGRNDA